MNADEFYNNGISYLDKGNEGSRKQELIDFAEAYLQHRVNLISDEIYYVIVYYGIEEPKASCLDNDIKNKILKL